MEKIKKKFQILSGGTGNTGASFNFKVLFTNKTFNLGFFETYEDTSSTAVGTTATTTGTTTITGDSVSRLEELRTHSVSTDLSLRYVTSTSPTNNGLDIGGSNETGDIFIYYISGITYQDLSGATTFSFDSSGCTDQDNKPIIYNESKMGLIANPKIDPEVFIGRQEIGVFENNYRLANIQNLSELETYAGGSFFTINNNT